MSTRITASAIVVALVIIVALILMLRWNDVANLHDCQARGGTLIEGGSDPDVCYRDGQVIVTYR